MAFIDMQYTFNSINQISNISFALIVALGVLLDHFHMDEFPPLYILQTLYSHTHK